MKLACETAEDYYDGALGGGGVVVFVMGFACEPRPVNVP